MTTKPQHAHSFGILSAGAYLPRLRLERESVVAAHKWMAPGLKSLAKGTRTMANWDEDVITMGVEAARAALAGTVQADVGALTLASTSHPFADRLNSAVLASALGLSSKAAARDVSGTLRSGTSALLDALQRPATAHAQLVIAAERRIPTPASTAELICGDGAAALTVGQGKPIAILLGSATTTRDFVDHFREAGNAGDYAWEERWTREEGYGKIVPEAIQRALESANCRAEEIDHFVMPSRLPKANQSVAKTAGIRPETVADTLFELCGDTGSAHALLMLVNTLSAATAGQKILVAHFANGCDAMVLEVTAEIGNQTKTRWRPSSGHREKSYLKYLSFTNQLQLEWGMRAEMDNKTALSALWRNESMIHGFLAGCCSQCGTVQFPSSRVCVNPECIAVDTQTPHRLVDEPAAIFSYTCDRLSYKQSPPFLFGHVQFDSGARVLMEFTDTEPDELAVGTPLAMNFRIKEFDGQRGFRRYFWKATPFRCNEEIK